ncbi:MAG: ATP-grasp domain-containing protein [Pseudomonadota bacterium]|nr:ATP-grasp domain-containing protein [Pseudomonadota bacterium]
MSSPVIDGNKVVLLGAAGTGTAFHIAARLRAVWGSAVRIIGIDINPKNLVTTSLLCDAFYQVPYASEDGFTDVIARIARDEGVTVYVPLLNQEIAAAMGLGERGAPDELDVWVTPEMARIACDKHYQAEWLAELSLPVPETATDIAELRSGQWFMKPLDGTGSAGALALTAEHIDNLTEQDLQENLVQELCIGPEVTVDSFYDAGQSFGRALCRERLETKSGVCTKARTFKDDQLSEYAAVLGAALEQRGSICFQVMQCRGEWVITDLNVRPGAGTAISSAVGFDLVPAGFAARWGLPYDEFFSGWQSDVEHFVTRQYSEFVMS